MKNKYEKKGDTVYITCTRGVTTVSVQDLPIVACLPGTWGVGDFGYIQMTVKGKVIKMHRLLKGFPELHVVHHIDSDPSNNTRDNLAIVSLSYNSSICKVSDKPYSNNTSGARGVYWNKRRSKYQVIVSGKSHGWFHDFDEATRVAMNAREAVRQSRKGK